MNRKLSRYILLIRKHLFENYKNMFREPGKAFKYSFITPGSRTYNDVLWDWDSWLTNVALRQIFLEKDNKEEIKKAVLYEKGCVLNFLSWAGDVGWIPICIGRTSIKKEPKDIFKRNMHKPVLAQHAAFLVKEYNGDAEWLRENENFLFLQKFVNNYINHHRHNCGIYFWQSDNAIGVDNDPCTYCRPPKSSGSVYLNCFMLKELESLIYLCECLNFNEIADNYREDSKKLKHAIQEYCWDERDGFYYSVDLNLLPIDHDVKLHQGRPRDWECLIQRIGVWSGFLALWAGVATQEQAKRILEEHYRNKETFNAPYGVRTLSKMEKMYDLRASGNPSSWLGPVWGVSNYLTFRGLVKYGFVDDAKELTEKTILLFGKDIERFGALHEYYQPENGEPILNRGFQNWNYLVLNMIAWFEGKKVVSEF